MKDISVLFLLLLFATPMLAQDQAAALGAGGCGPEKIEFDVKTDKNQHPMAQLQPGKALVYVFEEEETDQGSQSGSRR
jgi:hypothetical protein